MGKLHRSHLSRFEQLPDETLLLVLSFLPNLIEIARTCILSRRCRNLWRNVAHLNFDAIPLLTKEQPWTRERVFNSTNWYKAWVNKVVAMPRLTSVKELRIRYKLTAKDSRHINRWIDFAVANRVETLHLEFCPYNGFVPLDQQYKLSEERWCRAPSGLASLHCLKSLTLFHVNVTKQFIEFILASCPLLEDLWLQYAGTFNNLDVSSPRLRQLRLDEVLGSALKKLSAPHLTSFLFYAYSGGFYPKKIDAPMLTDLTIGGKPVPDSQCIMEYLKHFWHYLPQLEKLDLIMEEKQEFKLKEIPELVKLKYLKMRFNMDTDLIWSRILYFLNACPVLETFVLQIFDGDTIPDASLPTTGRCSYERPGFFLTKQETEAWQRVRERVMRQHNKKQRRKWRKAEKSCSGFKFLKVLELRAGRGKLIDQKVVKFIISKASNLEKLIIDTRLPSQYPVLMSSLPGVVEAVETKAKELCPPSIEINIVG